MAQHCEHRRRPIGLLPWRLSRAGHEPFGRGIDRGGTGGDRGVAHAPPSRESRRTVGLESDAGGMSFRACGRSRPRDRRAR
jgi:hypothetical protein